MSGLRQFLYRQLGLRSGVRVGKRFHVGPGSIISAPRKLSIGNDVYIGKHVTIQVDGKIGDGVLIANLVGIIGKSDHDGSEVGVTIRNAAWAGDCPELLSSFTTIGSDVWLGYGAIVLSGISIGDSCIVGAGSVVTRSVPANSIVVGNPARVIGRRFSEEALEKHWMILESRGIELHHDEGEV